MEKVPISSNLQGLENEKPIRRGEPQESISFHCNRQISSSEHQPTGEIVKEKSDIYRLQDEDFRARVHQIEVGQQDSSNHSQQDTVLDYDPVVHPDSNVGRLHLSVRYDDERSQLIVQIIDAQGIIRPEQIYAPDMCLTFSLMGNDRTKYQSDKHERIVVDNAPVQWKEPVIFCITYENAIQQNLHIVAANHTDPSAPRDREVFIPLNYLKPHGEQINAWFNFQFLKGN